MAVVLGIIILVGVVAILYWVQMSLTRGVNAAVNKTVMRGANEKGKRLTQQTLTFTANAPVDAVRKAVLASVKVEPEIPKVIAGVYLAGSSDTRLVYDLGSKVQTNFRAVLQLSSTPTGTRGSWEVTNWLKVNGLVAGADVMERVIAQINAGLRSVDPNAYLH